MPRLTSHRETIQVPDPTATKEKEFDVPDGWKLTGEYRLPKKGELFLVSPDSATPSSASFDYCQSKHYILEKHVTTHDECLVRRVKVPNGWRLTGEYRASRSDEYFLSDEGEPLLGSTCGSHPIVERGEPHAEVQMLHEHITLPLAEGNACLKSIDLQIKQEPPTYFHSEYDHAGHFGIPTGYFTPPVASVEIELGNPRP